jgi:hypothetical protein
LRHEFYRKDYGYYRQHTKGWVYPNKGMADAVHKVVEAILTGHNVIGVVTVVRLSFGNIFSAYRCAYNEE